MFFEKLFRRGVETPEPSGNEGAEGTEHLAPAAYFTDARIGDLNNSLGRLGSMRINSITHFDQ